MHQKKNNTRIFQNSERIDVPAYFAYKQRATCRMLRGSGMRCGCQIIGVIFFKLPMITPQTRYSFFFFWVSHNRVQRLSPPSVCYHPRRQQGQWGGTVKRHKAWWLSSSKVQSDSTEAHLCLTPTVCLYLWLWVREGQYTKISRFVFYKHRGGGGERTLRQHQSKGQKNRKEVTWAIHTCRK